MTPLKRLLSQLLIGCLLVIVAPAARATTGGSKPGPQQGRLVIVMVWDGLRPDSVTRQATPNLYALEHEGVDFAHNHAIYPTVTMVNAAALATGAMPDETGILGDSMYLLPALKAERAPILGIEPYKHWMRGQLRLEDARLLAALNGPKGFAGRLLGLDSVAQEVRRKRGYIALVGKQGPAFLWDDRAASTTTTHGSSTKGYAGYLFATDTMAAPADVAHSILAAMPPAVPRDGVLDAARDDYFTKIVIKRAIPAARSAILAGHPALVMLWLHNPDLTQHAAGLGTTPAILALNNCDADLGRLRSAIDKAGIAKRTDLIVVSDHGFATIRFRIDLNGLLASAGLKKSVASRDVVVVHGGGTDLVYLSRKDFPTRKARRAELQKIVDFAEAQEWCGVIFSRHLARVEPGGHGSKPYLGWIDGTFSEAAVGILNPSRSPDLVISFRELPDLSNKGLTGPDKPAFFVGANGEHKVKNRSKPLVHPVEGVIYADASSYFTTGMGMHGALGRREIHNFGAAIGPDFRRHFVDRYPTANTDIAPTIDKLLGVPPDVGANGARASGRALLEAMETGRRSPGRAHRFEMRTRLTLQGVRVTSTLSFTRLDGHDYLDGSDVVRGPLGGSP